MYSFTKALPALLGIILLVPIVFSCNKKSEMDKDPECAIPDFAPIQPYSDPVWHPGGELLGFNHTPLAGIAASGTGPCTWYFYAGKYDSTGFYLMNKDGSGFKRVTSFKLLAPAWSPDGKWLAFSIGRTLCKMPFNGTSFDTTQIIPLTTSGNNFFPSWTAGSDTLFFDSNNDAPAGTSFYSIWKMASDGTGKTRLAQSAGIGDQRMPYVGNDGKVYFTGATGEIYRMERDGANQEKYSNNGFAVRRPRYWQGSVFYEDLHIGVIQTAGSKGVMLVAPAVTYDVSSKGEIVYSKMESDITKYNKQIGTLWIMNADGSHKRQLTYNHF